MFDEVLCAWLHCACLRCRVSPLPVLLCFLCCVVWCSALYCLSTNVAWGPGALGTLEVVFSCMCAGLVGGWWVGWMLCGLGSVSTGGGQTSGKGKPRKTSTQASASLLSRMFQNMKVEAFRRQLSTASVSSPAQVLFLARGIRGFFFGQRPYNSWCFVIRLHSCFGQRLYISSNSVDSCFVSSGNARTRAPRSTGSVGKNGDTRATRPPPTLDPSAAARSHEI